MAAFLAYLAALAALLAARALGGGAWVTNALVGGAYIGLPLLLARGRPLGLDLPRPARAMVLCAAMTAATLLPFVLWRGGFVIPAGAAWAAVVAVVGVALPEEFFFRGFLQGAWARARRRTVRVLGADVGWEWPAATAAFAAAHCVDQGARGLLTAIPGLAFGWLYARTGSIWPGTLYHAACNLAAAWTGA